MSSNRRLPTLSIAALIAGLGAAVGVSSVQVQAQDATAQAPDTNANKVTATSMKWGAKVNSKSNPPVVMHRGLASAAPAHASTKKAKKAAKPKQDNASDASKP